jgi:hypothetical protein
MFISVWTGPEKSDSINRLIQLSVIQLSGGHCICIWYMFLSCCCCTADQSSGCPRCRGAVFEAEKLSANGISFHKRCATCNSCNIKLDASSLCSAADGEIYCQVRGFETIQCDTLRGGWAVSPNVTKGNECEPKWHFSNVLSSLSRKINVFQDNA